MVLGRNVLYDEHVQHEGNSPECPFKNVLVRNVLYDGNSPECPFKNVLGLNVLHFLSFLYIHRERTKFGGHFIRGHFGTAIQVCIQSFK